LPRPTEVAEAEVMAEGSGAKVSEAEVFMTAALAAGVLALGSAIMVAGFTILMVTTTATHIPSRIRR
jgi:hypothetical protein